MPTIGYASLPIVPSLAGAKAKIESDLSGIGREAGQRFGQDFSNAAKQALGTLQAAVQTTVLAVTGLATATAVAGVNFNALEQKSRAALATMLGSTQAASAQMDALNRLVATSPFGKDIFIAAQQQLIGFGQSADKVVPELQAINDAVAATGGGNQQLADLAFVMAQVSAAGKITGEDLIQFGQRGVNAAQLIGDALGKTGPEIKAAITAGTIDSQTAIDALTQGMEDQFGGASDAVKQTWDGVTQRISAQMRNLGSVLAAPFIDPQGGGEAIDWANKVGDVLVAIRTKFQPVYEEITARLAPALQSVTGFLDEIRAKIQGWDTSNITGLVDKLGQFAPTLAAGSAAMLAFSGHILAGIPILGNLLGSINPVVAAVSAFVLASPELRDALGGALQQIAAALAPVLPLVLNLVQTLADGLVPIVQAAVDVIGPLAQIVAAVLTPALKILQPIVDLLAAGLHAVGDVVGFILSPLQAIGDAFSGTSTAAAEAAKAWQTAQDNARGLISGVGDLSTTLDANTGAFTKNTEAAISNYLAKHDLNNQDVSTSGQLSVLSVLQQSGVDIHAVVQGILGDSGQLKVATDQINALMSGTAANDVAGSGIAAQLSAAGVSAQDLVDAASGLPAATSEWKDYLANSPALKGWNDLLANSGANAVSYQLQFGQLLGKIQDDTRGYGEVLTYVSAQQKAATDAQDADIQAKIAAGDIIGELNGKLQVNAEQWGKLAPSLATAGESGADLTSKMSELGYVSTDSTQALIDAANAALHVGSSAGAAVPGIDNLTGALQNFLANAAQIRQGITSALTGFVDPVDAYTQTVQQVQDQARDAMQQSTSGAKQVQQASNDAADAAVTAADRQKDAVTRATQDALKAGQKDKDAAVKNAKTIRDAAVDRAKVDLQTAKDAETAAQKRVDAAKKEADTLKQLSEQRKSDADNAKDELDAATFRLRAAEIATAAASAGLGSATDPTQRATWQRAYNDAVKDEAAARTDATNAQSNYDAKAAASTTTQQQSTKATQDQNLAEKELSAAKDHTADVTEDSNSRQEAADKKYQDAQDAAAARYQTLQDKSDADRQAAQDRYQALLDAKDSAEETSRGSTANMAGGVTQSISDMAANVQPSFDQYLQTLRDQVTAQQQWHDNIITLAGKVPPDVALQLAELGPKSAPMVQQLVDATDTQLQEWVALWPQSTDQGVQSMVDEIVASIPGATQAGGMLGQAQIDAMTEAMKTAKTPQDFANIITQFGVYMQQAASDSPIVFQVQVDALQAQNDLAAFYGAAYNPATYWGQGAHYAAGGPVKGAGTAKSDSIPAWLSNGEEVWAADEVAGAGGHGAVGMLRRMARDGGLRYADGGPVGRNEKQSMPAGLGRALNYYDNSTAYYSYTETEAVRINRNLSQIGAMDGLG